MKALCASKKRGHRTRIKVQPDGRTVDHSATKFIMNPYDEYAVEQVLSLKTRAS